MEGAEDGTDRLGGGRVVLELEQRGLDLGEMVDRLGMELREQITIFLQPEIHELVARALGGGRRCRSSLGNLGRRLVLFGLELLEHDRAVEPQRVDDLREVLGEMLEIKQRLKIERLGGVEAFLEDLAHGMGRHLRLMVLDQRVAQLPEQAVGGNQPVVTPRLPEDGLGSDAVGQVLNLLQQNGCNAHGSNHFA